MYIFIVTFIFVSVSLFFMDLFFRSCMLVPYIQFLHWTGIVIKPFTVCVEISRYNNCIRKLGSIKPKLLLKWFQLGAHICTIFFVPVIAYFSWNFIKNVNFSSLNIFASHQIYENGIRLSSEQFDRESQSRQLVVPVVPGVNLPFSQLPHYFISLFICMVFHEFGHALAASREKVAIEGCGIAVVLVFPMAYVRLSQEHLRQASLWQQIRIYAAGIWHNVALAGLAVLLAAILPFFLPLAFHLNNGVTVLDIDQSSGLATSGGLEVGDTILRVSDCDVTSVEDWMKCITDIGKTSQQGFCVDNALVTLENQTMFKGGEDNCCGTSNTHLCFKHQNSELMCLPGRKVIENGEFCDSTLSVPCCCQHLCVTPVLGEDERVIRIGRLNQTDVIYIGNTDKLISEVILSPWTLKLAFLSVQYVDSYVKFLTYIYMFSAGLAIINILPSYGLDGQYLCAMLVHYFLAPILSKQSHRTLLINILRGFGTFLLIYTAYSSLKTLKFEPLV